MKILKYYEFILEKIQFNIDIFKNQCNKIFNLKELEKENQPIFISFFYPQNFPNIRLNHYLIKKNNSDTLILNKLENSDEIKEFIEICFKSLEKFKIESYSRYCYLTIDQGIVEEDKTLREDGFHIDGLQGDEVSIKKPADYQFIWSNCLGTKFANQSFNTDNLDVSKINIFKELDKQVDLNKIKTYQDNSIILMNAYNVHSATKANMTQYRQFLRLSFTNTPITSIKMSINDKIGYNYKTRKTSGNIPKHLL